MAQRQIIFLVLAAIIGIGMVLLARNLLTAPTAAPAKQEAQVTTTKVLVAIANVPSGNFIAKKDFEWRSWPSDSPADGLFVQGQAADKDYVGGVLRQGVRPGEPLLRARVTMPNEGGFLSAVLAPGMRAMTIKITPTSGVAGLIFPNDRVDVILAHKLDRPAEAITSDRRVSETVLQNVRVLALDQKTNDQENKPKVAELATLEVNLKQAEKLALVAQMGTLSLVLRSVASDIVVDLPANSEAAADAAATQAAINSMPAAMPPVAGPLGTDATWDSDVSSALPPPSNRHGTDRRVSIIRGNEATEVVVPNSVIQMHTAGER